MIKKILKDINLTCNMIVVLQAMFWIVLIVSTIFGITENKKFIEVFLWIYLFEMPILLLIKIMQTVNDELIETAKNLIYEFDEVEMKEFAESIPYGKNMAIYLLFKKLRQSQWKIDKQILTRCEEAKIKTKE